jgi:D-arabinose 1-dehydrogenase-like Zn-dependent alcohol dehydrogenase
MTKLIIADLADACSGVDCCDFDATVFQVLHDRIAGEHRPDLILGHEGAGTVKKKLGFTLTSSKAEGDLRRYRIDTKRGR